MNSFKKNFVIRESYQIVCDKKKKKLEVKSDFDQYSPKLKMEFSWQLLHRQYWLFMLILNRSNSFSLLLPTQNQKSEKIFLIFEKRGNIPKKASNLIENPFIRYIISENPIVEVSTPIFKMWNFALFQKKHRRCMFICFVFFSKRDCIKPKVQDNWEGAHSNVNLKLLF